MILASADGTGIIQIGISEFRPWAVEPMIRMMNNMIIRIANFARGKDARKRIVVSSLNKLIEVNNDRNRQYKIAMDKIQDTALKPIFIRYYQQSLSFKYTLAGRVRQDGGN